MEEETTTAMREGWDHELRTLTAGGAQKCGTDGRSVDAMAVGGDTGKASSAVADKAGAGGAMGRGRNKGGGL